MSACVEDAQHFLECSNCGKAAQFYCNPCGDRLCGDCQAAHLLNHSSYHEIVLYRYKRQSYTQAAETCSIHSKENISLRCKQCEEDVCSMCINEKHLGHFLVHLVETKGDTADDKMKNFIPNISPETSKYPDSGNSREANKSPDARKSEICNPNERHLQIKMQNNLEQSHNVKLPLYSCHISPVTLNSAWISDMMGNICHVDVLGNVLGKMKINGRYGCHTVSKAGELLVVNQEMRCIFRISPDKGSELLLSTVDFTPISISSFSDGQLLIGMCTDNEKSAEVVRYNKKGYAIQHIEINSFGQRIYQYPRYITESEINGDICTSDKDAVVVVKKSGSHRFSYFGQPGSKFWPFGICTDKSGQILVYDCISHGVHMLHKNGQFLSVILTLPSGYYGQGLCFDNKDRLWCGHWDSVGVFTFVSNKTNPTPLKRK